MGQESESDQPVVARRTIAVEHIRIETNKSFLEVKTGLERLITPLDTDFLRSLSRGDAAQAASKLQDLGDLSIFQTRDHGTLLRTAGQSRNALQYEFGNPLTASSMTRHDLAAALYAPLRVLLYETVDGTTVFEYDRPSSLFAQFGDDRVTEVARTLDTQLETAILNGIS